MIDKKNTNIIESEENFRRVHESEENFRRVQMKVISIFTGTYTYDRLNKIDELNMFLGKIPAEDIITITQEKDRFYIFFKTDELQYKICSLCGNPMKWTYFSKEDKWKSKSFCPECDNKR